jgi:hypothetical protein
MCLGNLTSLSWNYNEGSNIEIEKGRKIIIIVIINQEREW